MPVLLSRSHNTSACRTEEETRPFTLCLIFCRKTVEFARPIWVTSNIMFAYRYCLIQSDRLSASGQWPQNDMHDAPKPPVSWRGGPLRDWRVWRTGRRLERDDVTPRETFSLLWCQLNQRYWVVPGDCTRMRVVQGDPDREREMREKWQPLQCRHLGESQPPRPGLWELRYWGDKRQHSSSCPADFEEFLPGNFFTGANQNTSCHFVGHLSLMLALQAMCPEDPSNIPKQIDEIFYSNDRPLFRSARSRHDRSMDRQGTF